MNYKDAIDFLFNKTLVFQHVGAQAYKPGLDTTISLNSLFGNPDKAFKSIHIAGTNGKGSTAHLIAAILQECGYKVGLYTSPHLIDFRERIRVNGIPIDEKSVVNFIERFFSSHYDGRKASFFELTTIMAFDYFKKSQVDYAVIETGLGGRLDSTNIISPILSVITNISLDHTQFLGNTLTEIASEKAGIIKRGVPVIIGEYLPETKSVFLGKAKETGSSIIFAEERNEIANAKKIDDCLLLETVSYGTLTGELAGDCQIRNANTVLNAISELQRIGIPISDDAIKKGFANVCKLTGLMGRWMKISDEPRIFCDTGHNTGGFQYIINQLKREHYCRLRIVIGFVSDKDIDHILDMLPSDAIFYFTQASVQRAFPSKSLAKKAEKKGLHGKAYPSVAEAYRQVLKDSALSDFIYIGGSTFVVADLLAHIKAQHQ